MRHLACEFSDFEGEMWRVWGVVARPLNLTANDILRAIIAENKHPEGISTKSMARSDQSNQS